MAEATLSPMMRQFHRIKASHPDAILFFRLGDFYEMFFEDAEIASGILDITLTARNKGSANEAPMCGVPHHSADGYLARLLEAGKKVAIAEQVEEASAAKGTVRREVVRVLSPGTLVEDDLLESRANNYIVAAYELDKATGVAALDVSTGDFVVAQFTGSDRRSRAREEIARWAPREICYPESQTPEEWITPTDPASPTVDGIKTWSSSPDWSFGAQRAQVYLREHFGVASLEGFDLAGQVAAVGAAGALLRYVAETSHQQRLTHVQTLRRYRPADVMHLDASTRRSLELTESWQDGNRSESLLGTIDRSVTSMGGRRMREWLLRPLRDAELIALRLDVVGHLVDDPRLRDGVRQALKGVHDLERLATRLTMGSAGPRDIAALRASLEALPELRAVLGALNEFELGQQLHEALDPCEDVAALIAARLVDEPPVNLGSGNVIRDGFDSELDRLRAAQSDGKGFIAGLEAQERERTGINSMKVRYNKVFGYFLEVSKSNLDKVPDEYIRKQTLTNAERYITPELKEFEEDVLGAGEKIDALEQSLFGELRELAAAEADRVRGTAAALASIDALAALAETASRNGWARPQVDESAVIEIRGGRHPVVEALQPDLPFVPNDAYLDDREHRIKLVTGPNMGGKSTYLRQIALIAVLGQMGSFVPADHVRLGVVDRVFTRVGASDNLARGASTFLVEMQETANILNNATERSLVLLDEVGRGTSTYDGLSIAWAVIEYLQSAVGGSPRTLFATHYHELTQLEDQLKGISNLSVAVHESGEGVVFLHRVEPGSADRSYGIHVGRLAGLPPEVIARAEDVLADLESGAAALRAAGPGDETGSEEPQFALFTPEPHPVAERLQRLDPDSLTPIEALNLVARWKRDFADTDEGD
ncbi:MAG: DNA mismatch repair protein MutS [Acidobacteria bacterium]|nr:DNA mismatch repair protein MutS [Acidobacteriota bacterium]